MPDFAKRPQPKAARGAWLLQLGPELLMGKRSTMGKLAGEMTELTDGENKDDPPNKAKIQKSATFPNAWVWGLYSFVGRG